MEGIIPRGITNDNNCGNRLKNLRRVAAIVRRGRAEREIQRRPLAEVKSRLEKYTQEILSFEQKYGVSFQEFDLLWDEGKIANRHSHEVEADYIDWEMLEMEKKELLAEACLRRTQAAMAFSMEGLTTEK